MISQGGCSFLRNACIGVLLGVLTVATFYIDFLPKRVGILEDKANFSHKADSSGFNSKWTPKTTAKRCVKESLETLKPFMKSQSGEDGILLKWFNGLCNGTYLEMGGLDGVVYSNTYVFNKKLSWKGVLVELGPVNFKALTKNRPNELARVNSAVCGEAQMIHYVEKGAVGGVWEFAAESFRNQWWKGVIFNKTIEIECSPLRDILSKHVGEPFYFDFFSLDIEGAEFDALLSLDFNRVGFGIIFAEADGHNELKNIALRTYLESVGYTFLKEQQRSHWFVNKNFGTIYKDLVHQDVF